MSEETTIIEAELKSSLHNFIEHHFQEKEDLSSQGVIKAADLRQIETLQKIDIPKYGRDIPTVMTEMEKEIFEYSAKLNHPRYLGFIPGPASLHSWVGDVMTSAFNLHAGSWMSTSAASYIEKYLIEWLSGKIGYEPETSGGLFVSGGSIANLTALVAARDKYLSFETIHLGVAYVSEQTHCSIIKALKTIGIPPNRIRKISVDSQYRMNTVDLEESIHGDISNGLIPFVIIANAGTTNTGSIDPLTEISNLCSRHGLWMHVDGAFGASILLTEHYCYMLDGIEKADSLSWDAHKWLFQTYGCGIVIVKDKKDLSHSFHTCPEYLRDLEIDTHQINYGDIGLELTRPARGLKLWFTLQTMGTYEISKKIEHGIHLAEYVKEELLSLSDWEIISEPQLAIINFRYSPSEFPEHQLDNLNDKISKSAIKDNYAGVFTTILNGQIVLRICVINPATTREDIRQTIAKLNDFAMVLSGT